MKFRISWRLLVAALILAAPAALYGQRPTAAQAQQLLQNNPDLVAQLRQRIMSSGMTPDQIRARLRAEGYPDNLLDAYLPGVTGGDSTTAQTADVFAAVMALGIADSTDIASFRLADSAARLRADTVRQAGIPDSLSRRRIDTSTLRSRPVGLPRGIVGAATSPDSGYYLFGLDVFARSTTQFEPNLAGPVDANYRVGPGDHLVIVLTGDVEAAYDREVTREGFIVIPQVGQVQVGNLTLGQVEDVLYSRLGRVYSGVRRGAGATTHFSVSPARLRSNQIYVLGDVQRPGSYRVSAAGTVLTALYAAGGSTEIGSLRRIIVRRSGRIVDSLDSYDYLLRGDATHDVRLENGDVVFVPTHGARVRIVGEVLRPATYEIRRGESLDDAIRDAGGFTAKAGRRRVQIERIIPPEQRTTAGRDRQVIDITTDQMASASETGFPVEAGDLIRIFSVATRVRDRVTVEGAVWTPGPLGFTAGMLLSQALRLAGGVKPDVYLGEVLISRLQSDSTRIELRASLRDTIGNVLNDVVLNEDDQVRVFSVTEFRPARYVAIAGAVRKPGRFPYREGMTVRDLVLLAGGLLENAHLQAAEVARLPQNRSGGRLATTIRVPLDSSYLFERASNARYLGPPGLPAPSGTAPEVPLEPYDNVLILEQPDWSLQRTVVLTGEVRFPGTYALRSKNEHLSDLIERAGGLTDQAYADGVSFFRKRGNLGRIGIDLPRVLKDSTFRDNLLLQDGDSINLPQFSAVVDVRGAVSSPVAVAYVPGKDIGYYIAAAGGLNRKADGKGAYVVQPNGKVESISHRFLLPDWKPTPRSGSVVTVPEKDPSEKRDYSALAGAAIQVAASLVAVVALIVSRPKN
jgi:protein involved in polysaccharide export with SLBB domain